LRLTARLLEEAGAATAVATKTNGTQKMDLP